MKAALAMAQVYVRYTPAQGLVGEDALGNFFHPCNKILLVTS